MTGFYSFPESSCRCESWNILRILFTVSSLPWVCIGDFNDLLATHEKRGKHEHPNWKLQGFKQAMSDCDLIDIGMEVINLHGSGLGGQKIRWRKGWIEFLPLIIG